MVDSAEPENIVTLLKQAIPVVVTSLNRESIADYFFGNYEGKTKQFGRVQAGELVGNVDSMEDELKRYYDSADDTNQIIEGLLSPVKLYMKEAAAKTTAVGGTDRLGGTSPTSRDLGAKIYTYPVSPSGFIEHGHSFTTARMSELYAWIYRLSQLGVNTYYTNNWEETARFLIAAYRNEQKAPDEHTTFKRIYRPKVYIKHEKNMTAGELEVYRLTKVLILISTTYNLGIGEVRATALANRFVNIMDLSLASVSDISATEGIGKSMAEKLLRAIGRDI